MKFSPTMEAPTMSLFFLLETSIVFKSYNFSYSFVICNFLHANYVDFDVVVYDLMFNNFFLISNSNFYTKSCQCIFWSNTHSIATTFFVIFNELGIFQDDWKCWINVCVFKRNFVKISFFPQPTWSYNSYK